MKNYFSGKIKSAKNNRRGLSLVELVVAVAILAAVSTVLLHSFVTSNNVTNKAIKIGEATDAAQNIQEAIETLGTGMFLSSDNALDDNKTTNEVSKLLTVTKDGTTYIPSYESVVDYAKSTEENNKNTEKVVNLTGIRSGYSTFDAVVTFKSGVNVDGTRDESVNNGFYEINNSDIINYSAPDGSYVQPFSSSSNPDITVESTIRDDKDFRKITDKVRTIRFDITGDKNDTDGSFSNIKVVMNWDYVITYSYDDFNSPKYTERTFNEYVSETIIDSGEWKSGDSYLTAYVTYYPSYSDESVRRTKSEFKDDIEIHNESDCPVKIILVKQRPHISIPKKGGYTSLAFSYMNESDRGDNEILYNELYSDSETKEDILNKYSIKHSLTEYEYKYSVNVSEFRSFEYVNSFNEDVSEGSFFTNAFINLGEFYSTNNTSFLSNCHYTINGKPVDLENTYDTKSLNESLKYGSVVEVGKFDRLYDVTIELKHSGEEETFATFKASVLK